MRVVRIFFTLLIGLAVPLLQAEQPPILDPEFNPLMREKIAGDLYGYRPKGEDQGFSIFAQSVTDMLGTRSAAFQPGMLAPGCFSSERRSIWERRSDFPGGDSRTPGSGSTEPIPPTASVT
jgi:hypothetical protein